MFHHPKCHPASSIAAVTGHRPFHVGAKRSTAQTPRGQTGAGVNEQPHGHSREVPTDGNVATHGPGKRTVSPPVAVRHGTRLHLPSDYSNIRTGP